jgi:hypothetical protein
MTSDVPRQPALSTLASFRLVGTLFPTVVALAAVVLVGVVPRAWAVAGQAAHAKVSEVYGKLPPDLRGQRGAGRRRGQVSLPRPR